MMSLSSGISIIFSFLSDTPFHPEEHPTELTTRCGGRLFRRDAPSRAAGNQITARTKKAATLLVKGGTSIFVKEVSPQ
jgi:hypothetical protein